MRARVRKALFEAFRFVALQADGFSLVPGSQHPLSPYGIVASTKSDTRRWFFIALVASDMDDSFSMRLAWSDSANYPNEQQDHGASLAELLKHPRGTTQIILGATGFVQLDPLASEHHAYMDRWKAEATAQSLAGMPIRPPSVPLLVPAPVELVISGVQSAVAMAWRQAVNELHKFAGQLCG